MTLDTREVADFERALARIGDLPQKITRQAAGKGATVVRRAIRNNAPVGDTGELRRGIVRKLERTRTVRGKAVYDIEFDPAKNSIFQKPIKQPGIAGGRVSRSGTTYAYYPASMEYGFLTRSKGNGLSYVPGYHFMRKAADASAAEARAVTIDTAMQKIEMEWARRKP